jgi:hypothetical protein
MEKNSDTKMTLKKPRSTLLRILVLLIRTALQIFVFALDVVTRQKQHSANALIMSAKYKVPPDLFE